MRNANWTRILTILLSLLALYALLAVLAGVVQRFITPLLLIILASIVAFVLTPVVDLLQKTLHIFRWVAILGTYLMLIIVITGLGYFMATPLIAQTKALSGAIKTPSTRNLQAMVSLETAAKRFRARALIYETNTVQTQTDPQTGELSCLPNSGPCAPPPCYAAYFLNQDGFPGAPTAIWSGAGCGDNRENSNNKVWATWRNGHGLAHPFKTVPRLLPPALGKLIDGIQRLSQASVNGTPVVGGKHPLGTQPTVTTQVPSSYDKAVKADLVKLRTDLGRATTDLQAEVGRTAYSSDATQVYQDSRRLASAAHSLYLTIKSSPILVLAIQNFFDQHRIPINVGDTISGAINKVRGQSTTVLNNAVAILTGTVNVLFDLLIIIIMSLYLLADGGRFIGWLMGLVPEAHREQAWFFVGSLNRVLGGYIRGQLLVAITVGVLAGVGSWVIGVPYALLLGIFAFLAESIPVMGPIIASVPAILVALFTLTLLKTLIVVGWFILLQQIEQNVVGPRITGHAVGIHPVVAMVAVIIGLEIGGIWGAFLAVPVAGILFVLVGEGYKYLVLRQPLQTAVVPESLEIERPGAAEPPGGTSAAG